MPIHFTCPSCRARTDVDDQFAGQSGPCAQCGATVTVPSIAEARTGQVYTAAHGSSRGLTTAIIAPLVIGLFLLLFCGGLGAVLLYPVYESKQAVATQQTQCAVMLQKIGLAMHAYHDIHGSFPPAVVLNEQGQAIHSWRVLLLPFLGRQDLHARYKMDEPWNGPNNMLLHAEIAAVYRCPHADHGPDSDLTDFAVITGTGTLFNGAESISLHQIPDGTSNTILVVELAENQMLAAEPVDVTLTDLLNVERDPFVDISTSAHLGVIHVLMADGSVRPFRLPLQQYDMHSLTTPAGGEVVVPPQ